MNKKIMQIGKPYIILGEQDIFEESIRFCADIRIADKIKTCYFEFESKYEQYIVQERSDAFVMGLLSSAMELGYDISFEAPISEKLYYQLTYHYIPVVSKYVSFMHSIKLMGDTDTSVIRNEGAVGTGCSGGVDSFYTIVTHTEGNMPKGFRLTHLAYTSNGTLDAPRNEKRIKQNYVNLLEEIRNLAAELKLDLVPCYNNLHHFYKFPYHAFCEFYAGIFAAPIYALQGLFNVYYESGDWPIDEFDITLKNSERNDFCINDAFTLPLFSSENLTLYSVGEIAERSDKVEIISNNAVAQKYLNVCGRRYESDSTTLGYNCSECPKCVNTMTLLDICGKLDLYSNVFDVNNFKQKKAKLLGYMMIFKEKRYIDDLIAFSKRKGYSFPMGTFFWKNLVYRPFNFLRLRIRKFGIAKKIYYRLNLDYKMHGYRNGKAEEFIKNSNSSKRL